MDKHELSFTYFPDNYRWSHGLSLALGGAPWGGGEIGEINRVGLKLRERLGNDRAWFEEWARMAETVEKAGRERAAAGKDASAAAYLFRAAHYYHVGERFLQPKDAAGLAGYKRGVDCFRDAARRIRRPRIEHVELPYEGTSLPALFVHAEGSSGRTPALVFFDGFDVTERFSTSRASPISWRAVSRVFSSTGLATARQSASGTCRCTTRRNATRRRHTNTWRSARRSTPRESA